MSEQPPPEDGDAEQGSVFGKLPASRPGTRSPRRKSGAAANGPRATRATKAKAAPKPRKPPAPEPARPAAPSEPSEPPQGADGGGLDDLAWAGVAAVAEAATIGVRLANRALGALRDSVDRR